MNANSSIALLQAAAYVTLAVVAIVTLKRASATVLQPIRTEVFKAQLEELRGVLQLIGRRDEGELREVLGFYELFAANALRLHDEFFRDVYGIGVDESQRPYSLNRCSYSIAGDDFVLANHESSDYPFHGQIVGLVTPRPESADDARSWWRKYRLGELRVPNQQTEVLDQLGWAATSPMLPTCVADRIEELVIAAEANRSLLFEVLSAAGRELPVRFTSDNPPATFDFQWISDNYNARFTALKPRADAVAREIRKHLSTDKLMKPWQS